MVDVENISVSDVANATRAIARSGIEVNANNIARRVFGDDTANFFGGGNDDVLFMNLVNNPLVQNSREGYNGWVNHLDDRYPNVGITVWGRNSFGQANTSWSALIEETTRSLSDLNVNNNLRLFIANKNLGPSYGTQHPSVTMFHACSPEIFDIDGLLIFYTHDHGYTGGETSREVVDNITIRHGDDIILIPATLRGYAANVDGRCRVAERLSGYGYEIIWGSTRDDEGSEYDIPLIAIPTSATLAHESVAPTQDDILSRTCIVISNVYELLYGNHECQAKLFAALAKIVTDNYITDIFHTNASDIDASVASIISAFAAEYNAISSNADMARISVNNYTEELNAVSTRIAEIHRSLSASQREYEALSRYGVESAARNTEILFDSIDKIREIRTVQSAGIRHENGSVIISFTTKPYVMNATEINPAECCDSCWSNLDDVCTDDDCSCHDDRERNIKLMIPPLTFDVDTSIASPEGAIRCVGDNRHPHISTANTICWGNAGPMVADRIGIRDWPSLVMVICGWLTQYNYISPYQRASDLELVIGVAEDVPAGWVNDEPTSDNETTNDTNSEANNDNQEA